MCESCFVEAGGVQEDIAIASHDEEWDTALQEDRLFNREGLMSDSE